MDLLTKNETLGSQFDISQMNNAKDTLLQQISLDPLPRKNMKIQGAEEGGTIDVR